MAKPFGVGDVVGGRYRVTHHVVTSADQDIVFQAVDDVLDREVSVLLASRANAKQVATSAKELATGERASDVQVLDLGLAGDRTYLISSVVDPNDLLDLVVPDAAPFVEPYFTDSLGSELFGQSREMQPQTYEDDDEYYSRLQADLAESAQPSRKIPGFPRRRPSFLDKVTSSHAGTAEPPQESVTGEASLRSAIGEAGDAHGIEPSQEIERVFSLSTDLDEAPADPAADVPGEVLEATYAWTPSQKGQQAPGLRSPASAPSAPSAPSAHDEHDSADPSQLHYEHAPSAAFSAVSSGTSRATSPPATPGDPVVEGEEVVDDPPAEPDPSFDRRSPSPEGESFGSAPFPPTRQAEAVSVPAEPEAEKDPASFTGLINAVPPKPRVSFPAGRSAPGSNPELVTSSDQGAPPVLWWVAAGVLAALVLSAAILIFFALSGN